MECEKHPPTALLCAFNFILFAVFPSPLKPVFAFRLHFIYLVACQLVSILLATSTLAAAEIRIKILNLVGATKATPTRLRNSTSLSFQKMTFLSFSLLLAPDLIPTDSSMVLPRRDGFEMELFQMHKGRCRFLLTAAFDDGSCKAGVAGFE